MSQSLSLHRGERRADGHPRCARRKRGHSGGALRGGLRVPAPLLSLPGNDSVPASDGGRAPCRARGLARRRRAADPEADIRGGLALVEEALSRNPHNARAWLAKGRLLLERARDGPLTAGDAEDEQRAREAFDAALRESPLLAHEKPDWSGRPRACSLVLSRPRLRCEAESSKGRT